MRIHKALAVAIVVALACLLPVLTPVHAQDAADPEDTVSDAPIVPGPTFGPARDGDSANPYQGDRSAIREGRRLYGWYNCSGCHAPKGGGGMGPPLSDAAWIYGDDATSIYQSIMQGRPNGMPAWAGSIPADEIWKIVTYVQSLPGGPPTWAPQD